MNRIYSKWHSTASRERSERKRYYCEIRSEPITLCGMHICMLHVHWILPAEATESANQMIQPEIYSAQESQNARRCCNSNEKLGNRNRGR